MNIGIVGAGIVGRLLAFELIEKGYSVTLFDKTHADDQSTTSHVAAGLLSPYSELEHSDADLLPLSKDSVSRWRRILAKLRPQPELNDLGTLLISHKQNLPELNHFINRAKRSGITFSPIDSSALSGLEPELSDKGLTAIHLQDEGCLNATEVMNALKCELQNKQIVWKENTLVCRISQQTVYMQTGQASFDQVFDCRGLGSVGELKDLRGVRGELIELHAPHITLTRPIRVLHPRYPLYIVPRKNNHYMVGATCIESEDYSPISVQSTLELLSACYSIHSGFAEARIIQAATQCRPALSNHLPQIIKTPDCIHINGLYRHGFLLSPRVVSDALTYLKG